ncbi:MAG: glycerol kinase GlpK [Alphaproteobacteria bacterium]|nr:glycerol kinase GlpK [Alphaproteobacteria bacterium]
MAEPYLLAIDQGTTSSRAIVFDVAGKIIHLQQKELTLHYPQKGWVEQDANDIWDDTLSCLTQIADALGNDLSRVVAAGITNQRETTIVWDRETGEPVYHAIVWQDRRTAQHCQALNDAGHEEMITAKTGLLLDAYFSATKIAWILDHVEGARDRAEAGELLFGTVDSFLLWKLTKGAVHATDATNASRSMLFNVVTQEWDEELLALFDIPRSMLPDVYDNVADYGCIDSAYMGAEIPIGGVAGDQQAALIGQGCFDVGMVKSTYGTGCFALMNIGDDFKVSQHRLLTTVAYRFDGKVSYALEGSIFIAGAAIQWLRDGVGLFDDAANSEDLARSVDDNNEVYFVPAFTGLGAPHWKPDAQAMICGLTRESNAAHIVRAALEAQAYQTCDLMGAMEADGGVKPDVIRADGGLVANGFMCQFLADMLNMDIEIPAVVETTAWGAACLAGLSVGVFDSLDDVRDAWHADRHYEPAMHDDERARLYAGWQTAVSMLTRID